MPVGGGIFIAKTYKFEFDQVANFKIELKLFSIIVECDLAESIDSEEPNLFVDIPQ